MWHFISCGLWKWQKRRRTCTERDQSNKLFAKQTGNKQNAIQRDRGVHLSSSFLAFIRTAIWSRPSLRIDFAHTHTHSGTWAHEMPSQSGNCFVFHWENFLHFFSFQNLKFFPFEKWTEFQSVGNAAIKIRLSNFKNGNKMLCLNQVCDMQDEKMNRLFRSLCRKTTFATLQLKPNFNETTWISDSLVIDSHSTFHYTPLDRLRFRDFLNVVWTHSVWVGFTKMRFEYSLFIVGSTPSDAVKANEAEEKKIATTKTKRAK